MSIRTALHQSTVVTLAMAVAALWLLSSWTRLYEAVDLANLEPTGQGAIAGVVGLLVLTITLGLVFVLAGELGEATPGPNQWPPAE